MAWDGKTNNYPFPIYFGEHFHIGDRELMEQCRLDATRTRQSCNEQCSYWKGSTASEKSAESDAVGDRPDGDDAGQVKKFDFILTGRDAECAEFLSQNRRDKAIWLLRLNIFDFMRFAWRRGFAKFPNAENPCRKMRFSITLNKKPI